MTDKEKIIAEIERRRAKYKELISKSFGVEQEYFKGMAVVADEMMLFINSLPAEHPSGDFKEEFNNFCVHGDIRNPNFEGPFGYDDIRKTAIHFADWQKEQTINKACEWLNGNVVEYHPRKGELRPIVNINAFREAMEKEDKQ